MSDNDKKKDDGEMLEYTTSVKQGHADIGKFNIACYIVLAVVSIVYLILHFKR